MFEYAASDNMLVDFITREHQGNFDLHVMEDQCAYLQFGDGREGFFETGDHTIRMNRFDSMFHRHDTVNLFWFNLSDQIEIHLNDTVQVMEQLLKAVDPELKLYAPVTVRVLSDITVRIADRSKLLNLLFDRQAKDFKPSLDKFQLKTLLEKKLHYLLEESLNKAKRQMGLNIFELNQLSESVEIALITEICSVLDSLSLELVSARITRMGPTRSGMDEFQKKEAETLNWYNQVQMDCFSRRSGSKKRKTKNSIKADTAMAAAVMKATSPAATQNMTTMPVARVS